MDDLQEGILIETLDRQILQVNSCFCKLFGIVAPPSALVGTNCVEAAAGAAPLFVDRRAWASLSCMGSSRGTAEQST